MRGTTRTRPQGTRAGSGINAVVSIEPARAIAVRGTATGEPTTMELAIPDAATATVSALAVVAHWIGQVDRVLVLGPETLRTALEREIVAIGHRPETICEDAAMGRVDRELLVDRLRHLA